MIKVIQYGLGPIGCAMLRLAVQRPNLHIVGAIDIDPSKVGKDAGEIAGISPIGVRVCASLKEVLAQHSADIVVHTTSSYFDLFQGQILEIVGHGLNVVSTAEELSFPWHHHQSKAQAIHDAALAKGVTVLGTGINPGFLMDSLPIALTSISQQVERLDIRRAQNASRRRGPFQKKIGSGMSVEDFKTAMASGRMGHVGLPESMAMIFAHFNKNLLKYEEKIAPVVAKRQTTTNFFDVPAGKVIGLRQTAKGHNEDGVFCTMSFIAYLDNREDKDSIKITGTPNLKVTLEGTNGDIGTAAITINAIKRVVAAPAGLTTMKDLVVVGCG